MPLDAETIKRLTTKSEKRAPAAKKPAQGMAKKGSRRGYMGIRVATHYPHLIKNDFVKHVPGTETTSTMGCTSYGCSAPSYYLFLGQPLCSIHLEYALVIELQGMVDRANGTSGGSNQLTPEPRTPELDGSSLVSAVIINGSEEDGDSYL